jgi:hypothetical protein
VIQAMFYSKCRLHVRLWTKRHATYTQNSLWLPTQEKVIFFMFISFLLSSRWSFQTARLARTENERDWAYINQ